MPRPLDIRTTLAAEINERGYTLVEVSKACNISYMHLKHAAAGRRPISMANLQAIARFISVPVSRLYAAPSHTHPKEPTSA